MRRFRGIAMGLTAVAMLGAMTTNVTADDVTEITWLNHFEGKRESKPG